MNKSTTVRRIGIVLLWLLTIWETFTMGGAGIAKLGPAAVWVHWFGVWGYPVWFMKLIATVELVGAVLLLIPRVAPYAAGSLIVIMLGALFTISTREAGNFTLLPVIVHLVGLAVIAWFRRPGWLTAGAAAVTDRASVKTP